MPAGPTQRTLALLRNAGYMAAVVERWNAHSKVRQDLFGWIDVVAVRPDKPGVLGVQCTSASNLSSRVKKILAADTAYPWLAAGNRVWVLGWKRVGKRWRAVRRELCLDDLKGGDS